MIPHLIARIREQQRATNAVIAAAYPQLNGRTGVIACAWEDFKALARKKATR